MVLVFQVRTVVLFPASASENGSRSTEVDHVIRTASMYMQYSIQLKIIIIIIIIYIIIYIDQCNLLRLLADAIQ